MDTQAANPRSKSGSDATCRDASSHFGPPLADAKNARIIPIGARKKNSAKLSVCGSFQGGKEGEAGWK